MKHAIVTYSLPALGAPTVDFVVTPGDRSAMLAEGASKARAAGIVVANVLRICAPDGATIYDPIADLRFW